MENETKKSNKVLLTVSLLLNALFILVILAGVFKFNFTNSDIYVDDGTEVNEQVIYGEVAEVNIIDPNSPDPDAVAIAEADAETQANADVEEDPFANAAAGEEELTPAEPATTTSADSTQEPDNSPVQESTATQQKEGEEV